MIWTSLLILVVTIPSVVEGTGGNAESATEDSTSIEPIYTIAHCETWDSHIKIEKFETNDCTGRSTPTYTKMNICEGNQKYIVEGAKVKMELYPDDSCTMDTVLSMLHGDGECIVEGEHSRKYTISPNNHKVVIYEPHTTADCTDNVAPMVLGQDDCTLANSKFTCLDNNNVVFHAYSKDGTGCTGTSTKHSLSTACTRMPEDSSLPVDGESFKW